MPGPLAFAPPVISVDVEDWMQSTYDRDLPLSERAAANSDRMLELLDAAGVQGTMFVLGKFAEAFPEAVRRIHAAGHEIGCHGHGHIEIFRQSRADFSADVTRAKQTLEQIIGEPVRGYRAPDFSIVTRTTWALELLGELGFDYDSSIFPVRHRRYGIPGWPDEPVRVALPSGATIVELPIASLRLLGRNLPVGGGGYHRLLPGLVARTAAARVMQRRLFVYYCHPYELDPRELWETEHPIPLRLRLHQGLGRGRFRKRLERFLQKFGGRPARDALSSLEPKQLDLEAILAQAAAESRTGGRSAIPLARRSST
jgi:polysaccharide deacetylase family protein (PEP-CTERM system associated)